MRILTLLISLFIQTATFSNENTSYKRSIIYCDGALGGRLGDKLIAYIKSKWAAYNNNLPLYVRPFEYYECFKASDIDLVIETLPEGFYQYKLTDCDDKFLKKYNTIYRVSYYPLLDNRHLEKMKKDPIFLQELRELISPKDSLDYITPPNDIISVAVHIRKGGGYDNPLKSVQIFDSKEPYNPIPSKGYQDKDNPLKFPPEQYYINQIKRISKILSHKPIYLFIFTDDQNPLLLCKRIKKNVNLENITFDCRKINTGHDKNVLEDFFSMLNFDCFIRPGDSQFSRIAHLLGDYKIEIYPTKSHWEKDKNKREYLIMDGIKTLSNISE